MAARANERSWWHYDEAHIYMYIEWRDVAPRAASPRSVNGLLAAENKTGDFIATWSRQVYAHKLLPPRVTAYN
jgi:hypothetical protein